MKEYLVVFLHNLTQDNGLEWLDFTKSCVEVIVGIMAILGGVAGLFYLNKQRDKRRDASFGYMAQLNVHIRTIKNIFENESEKLLNQLVCPNDRIPWEDFPDANHDAIVALFKNRIEQTLEFLMSTDNQMPVYKGWTERMLTFLHFLEDFSFAFNVNGFLWQGNKNKIRQLQDKYKKEHIDNMVEMLEDIKDYQKEIESKISKKRKAKKHYDQAPCENDN